MAKTVGSANAADLVTKQSSSMGSISGAMPILRKHAVRLGKAVFGFAVLGVGLWYLLRHFVFLVSTEAIIAGNLSTLRAPIDGLIQGPAIGLGQSVETTQVLGVINNPWVDDTTVRGLEVQLGNAEAEVSAIGPLIDELEDIASGLKEGTTRYQVRRVTQLRAVAAEVEARLNAQRAQSDEAEGRVRRAQDLSSEGLVSSEKQEEAKRDSIVAGQTVQALQRTLEATVAQLDAAQKGINIDAGGMGSDRPYSHQRLDEVRIELARWRQRLDEQRRRRAALGAELDRARARLKQFTTAQVVAPHRGRIWQILTAPETFVSKGTAILSMLDCDNMFVMASVSQRVFNHLRSAGHARFKVRETGEAFSGEVVQLLGPMERVPGTLIAPVIDEPGAPYRVVLAIPELAHSALGKCPIGQSGEVTFL